MAGEYMYAGKVPDLRPTTPNRFGPILLGAPFSFEWHTAQLSMNTFLPSAAFPACAAWAAPADISRPAAAMHAKIRVTGTPSVFVAWMTGAVTAKQYMKAGAGGNEMAGSPHRDRMPRKKESSRRDKCSAPRPRRLLPPRRLSKTKRAKR